MPLVDGINIDVAGAIGQTASAPDKASTFASNVTPISALDPSCPVSRRLLVLRMP